MEKRLILAITLSFLILLTWSARVSKTYHQENKEVTEKKLSPAQPSQATPLPEIKEKEEISLDILPSLKHRQDNFEIDFIEPLAAIKEVTFKKHQDYKFSLEHAFLIPDKSLFFKKESAAADTLVFVHSDKNKKIIKRFIFDNSNYTIRLEINVQNETNVQTAFNLTLVLGLLDFSGAGMYSRYKDVTVATKERVLYLNGRKDINFPEVNFLGLRERYFCAIVEPEDNAYQGLIKKINHQKSELILSAPEVMLQPGQSKKYNFHIYLGPQELRIINQANPNWAAVVHYGAFNFISQILLQLLEFLARIVRNWGLAIVILSVLVYFVLYPLTLKQMRSMKEMQALQPRIEELRRAYKDSPQKLNKEIMELYREHKVNPFGGCLPLILQIPIFFALYQALMRSVALKGANFLWIKDLSEPDRLFILPISLPFIGNEINLIPLLMAIGMFFQQKMSSTTLSTSSSEQQKILTILFPLLFGFIFYHMPAGLVLYWFINSSLMLFNQLLLRQRK